MKNINLLLLLLIFPVKLICFITSESASNACGLLKAIAYHFIMVFEVIVI